LGRAPGWQVTNDAYLQSDLTPIAAKVGGYVREVPVQDFEHVHAGQLLAQLVDDDYKAAVALVVANVASAEAQAQALKAQRELQLANVQAARAVVAAITALSEQNLVAVDAQVAASDAALVQNQIAVFKALGGGWQASPRAPESAAPLAKQLPQLGCCLRLARSWVRHRTDHATWPAARWLNEQSEGVVWIRTHRYIKALSRNSGITRFFTTLISASKYKTG
jgi:pyruvate/2-oxoglutarate dehydrogenase complex dihydrolipoamide acyltransferase (E2) component